MNTRQQMILQMVADRGRMNVVDLARMTGVSEVTIRHDLNLLEKENFLRRAHGYAVPLDSDNVETRMMNNYPLKRRLAEYAASLVDNGETVFIENGSCNALLARALAEHKSITLITVSAYIAHLLKDTPCEVVLLGGIYQKQSESMVGPLTRKFIQQVHFTKAFIGADGWLPNTGFTGRDMLRSEVVNTVLEKNVQSIVLTDSSKFGCLYPYGLGPDSALRRVITDSGVSDDIRQQLESRHEMIDIVPTITGD